MIPIFLLTYSLSFGYSLAPADSTLSTRRTAADTVQALHHLFERRRKLGAWLVGGSATVTAVTGVGTAIDLDSGRPQSGYYNPKPFDAAVLMAIGTAPVWIPGTVTLIRFSKKREKRAIVAYEQTHQLPRRLQKRLNGKDFR